MKTAQQAAANWSASSGRAQAAWTEGVNSYSGDWAGSTVAQESALLQGFQQAVTSGAWRRGVQNTGTSGWKAATQAKAANYGVGFSAGSSAYTASSQKIMNALQGIVGSLPARGTFEQNKVRATYVMDSLHALRGQLGAR